MKVIREHMEHAAWEFLGDVVSEHVYGVIGDATLETMRQFGARSSRSSLWALAALHPLRGRTIGRSSVALRDSDGT